MNEEVKSTSLLVNNSYLKEAFSKSRYADPFKKEIQSIFTNELKYPTGENSSAVIDAVDLEEYRKFFTGVDYETMLSEGKLRSFEYDANNDGNFELSLKKYNSEYKLYVDENSDGSQEIIYSYTPDGIIQSKMEFEGIMPTSYTTYNEYGNSEDIGTQIINGLCLLATQEIAKEIDEHIIE